MEKRVSTSARPAHKSKKPRIQPSSSPNKSSSLLSKNGVKIGHVTSNDGSTASKGVAFVDTASKRDVKSSRATQRGKGVALTPIKEAQEYPTSFKIIAGSYEKILYGLEATFDPSQPSTSSAVPILKPVFIFPAHVACIKAVAASPNGGKWLATGSTDEIIKVWDLRRRKEIGGLVQHEGSITHLTFPSRSHLLSASEDGTLCLFRARDWALLRTLKGHTGRINCVAVHPSGKVALSVGKDRTLRMWDLMRGKGSASTKLGKEGEVVRWSTTGKLFAVQTMSTIDIFTTDMKLIGTIKHPSRIQDLRFYTREEDLNEVLLVGAEDKKVTVYNLGASDSKPDEQVDEDISGQRVFGVIAELVGHTNRVKAIDLLAISLPSKTITTYASTVSSDGKINVYDLASLPPISSGKLSPKQIEPITSYDTKGTRLTCLAMADGEMTKTPTSVGVKRRLDEEGDAKISDDGETGSEEEEGDQEKDDEEEELEEEEG